MALVRSKLMILKSNLEDNTAIEVTAVAHARLTEETAKEARSKSFDEGLIVEYEKFSNGRNITWWKDEKAGIGGVLDLVRMESMFKPQPFLISQCDNDEDTDQDLRYFKVLDVPTSNSMSGFFDLPDEGPSKQIYFLTAGSRHADGLDLDFNGYMEMACESKLFFYWQKVLIDIKKNKESPETRDFREIMPTIFSDFDWDTFVEKYNSLRLSLNK